MHRLLNNAVRTVVAVATIAFTTTSAFAQNDAEELPPFDVPGLEQGATWVPWVFAFLFVALFVLAGVKNPHRNVTDRD